MHRLATLSVAVIAVSAISGTSPVEKRTPSKRLSGLVTTDQIVVSAQLAGQITEMPVREGDSVTRHQLLAIIRPDEVALEQSYFAQTVRKGTSAVAASRSTLRLEERQFAERVRQAEATLASTLADRDAAIAQRDDARATLDRARRMYDTGITSTEQIERARTAYTTAVAAVASIDQRIEALRAAVALAASAAEEIAVRRSRLQADEADRDAAETQLKKATVRLGYGEIRSPIDGVVNIRAARAGEVVQPGQALLSLIDERDIWIRIDVEETEVGQLPIGATLPVTLADGSTVTGRVFYRAADGDFATQRDVSRGRRDIRAVQVRLRAEDAAGRLVVGTTAYVDVPAP